MHLHWSKNTPILTPKAKAMKTSNLARGLVFTKIFWKIDLEFDNVIIATFQIVK